MDYVILSVDQLINSNYLKAINNFASLSSKMSIFPKILTYPYYYISTVLKYWCDEMIFHNIKNFKLGISESEEFISFLRNKFCPYASDDELVEAWNSSCEINDAAIANVKSLFEIAKKREDIKIIILGAKDELHTAFMHSQMLKILNITNRDELAKKIEVFYSWQEGAKTLELSNLGRKALLRHSDTENVYSINKNINDANSLVIKPETFKCISYNSSQSNLIGEFIDDILNTKSNSNQKNINLAFSK